MKQHYKKGAYVILFLLMAAAYVAKMREASLGKSVSDDPTSIKSKISSNHPAAAVHDTTMASIQQSLARREYNISLDQQKNTLQSPNRKQGLRAYYKPGVLTLNNRVDSAGHNFSLKLVNEGIFADGKKILSAQPGAKLENGDNKLQIKHKGFTEEFINDEEGVRQNFIIYSAPVATKELQVRLSAQGLKVNDLGNNELHFFAKDKQGKFTNSLIYKDITCWDAGGDTLPATLRYQDGLIMLTVNVQDAAYPVTIDPIVVNGNPANASAIIEGNQAGAQAGYAVSSAGDVNGDGYSDVLVGAPFFDSGETNEGVVFVYHGSASGLSPNAAVILQGNQNEAQFGTSVSSAGDINKDGYSDVIIGAPFYTKGQAKEGAAMVYFGSASGLNGAATILESNQPNAKFGRAVEGLGDVNGDGFSDIIVGAPLYDKGQPDEGAAFIYHGSAAGINLLANNILESNQEKSQYGYVSAAAGDVNGDGYNDVLVGAYAYDKGHDNEGAVFVHLGSAVGVNSNASVVLEGNQINAQYGWSAATAGDVNGDGYSDILVGSYLYDYGQTNEGAVFVYHGSAQGIKASAALRLESNQAEAKQGISVACAGDVNGDGYSDVMIGVWQYDKGQSNEGTVVIHHGSPNGLTSEPASTLESNQPDAGLGWSAKSAGDVNGDGYSDIITGANTYDNGLADEGAAFVWLGMAEGISNAAPAILEGAYESSFMGCAVSTAGDVNGDGYSDIIVGARHFQKNFINEGAAFLYYGSKTGIDKNSSVLLTINQSSANMGWSVTGGGDVNGDGFGDVLVGAPGYKGQGKGGVLVYYGSPNGISNAPSTILFYSKGNCFGSSVSDAGDLNSDGYSDVVVGDFNQNNRGAFTVFYGSATGPNPNTAINVEGSQTFAEFGSKVAGAGDVNGDGYSDLLIGARYYSNGQSKEGQVSIYHGSALGIKSVANIVLEFNEVDACIGTDLAGAGDINGDGYSDIIIGSSGYKVGTETINASVRILYGSLAGISGASVVKLEGSSEGPTIANPIASGGDVNGDGYSDIVIGVGNYFLSSKKSGAIFTYFGSAAGINNGALPSSITGNNDLDPTSGDNNSIASAGDVNGDGYSDIVIGSPWYAISYLFYGNSAKNIQNNSRLYNTNLSTSINQSQKAQNNFGAGLFAKSFLGKNRGKLVWETKANGQGFSKGGNNQITTSTQSTGAQTAYVDLGLSGKELKNLIAKQGASTKVRVRVKYDRTLALTGQLYGPWRYLPAYLLGNSIAPAPEDVVDDMSETVKRKAAASELLGTEKVLVYPNPVSDKLYIETNNPDLISHIQLFTSNGRSICKTVNNNIDVRGIEAGMYILVITRKDGSQTSQKVAINR